jgi:hypothetical protein
MSNKTDVHKIFISNLSGTSEPIVPQISQRKQEIIIPKEKEKIIRLERAKALNFEKEEKYEIQIDKILKPKDEIRRKPEFRKDDSIFPNILKKIEKKEEVKEKSQEKEKKEKKIKNIYKREEGNSTILFLFSFLKFILIFLGILSETKKKEPEMDLNSKLLANKMRRELEEAIQIGDEKRASFLGRELARLSK